jgi:enamine deaminase RidA (YjgF/YER057c/UK114 family)
MPMPPTVDQRLAELGIVLPTPAAPIANYVGATVSGSLLIVSGQLCFGPDGKLVATGKLGGDVEIELAKTAARYSAVGVLAQAKAALGSLDRIGRILRLGGFIACTAEFTQHAAVMNGASDLMVEVLGDKGRHTRTTVGVASLPLDAAVEVDALIEVA